MVSRIGKRYFRTSVNERRADEVQPHLSCSVVSSCGSSCNRGGGQSVAKRNAPANRGEATHVVQGDDRRRPVRTRGARRTISAGCNQFVQRRHLLAANGQRREFLVLLWLSKNSFRFRINGFARLLRKVNDFCYEVNVNCLTLCLNVRASAT